MRFFLASRVHNEFSLKKLQEVIGGFAGKKIAYIPTAANGEDGWESWKTKKGGTWELVNNLYANVKTVVLENYGNNSVIKELMGNDIVWFAGGMAGYLLYWIQRCKIDLNVDKILSGQTLYVGSSAGAMVAGQTIQISNWLDVDGERGSENFKPMGLVDFDIFPHFKDEYLAEIKKKYTGPKIYLLKDGEEIIVEDDKVEVIGEQRIITNG